MPALPSAPTTRPRRRARPPGRRRRPGTTGRRSATCSNASTSELVVQSLAAREHGEGAAEDPEVVPDEGPAAQSPARLDVLQVEIEVTRSFGALRRLRGAGQAG